MPSRKVIPLETPCKIAERIPDSEITKISKIKIKDKKHAIKNVCIPCVIEQIIPSSIIPQAIIKNLLRLKLEKLRPAESSKLCALSNLQLLHIPAAAFMHAAVAISRNNAFQLRSSPNA
jgi:hypothetical protein